MGASREVGEVAGPKGTPSRCLALLGSRTGCCLALQGGRPGGCIPLKCLWRGWTPHTPILFGGRCEASNHR